VAQASSVVRGLRAYRELRYSSTQVRLLRHCPSSPRCARSRPRWAAWREPADLRSLEWDEAGGAGERRDDEAVQVVQDRPGDQFGEVGVFGGLAVALLGLAPQLVVPVGASVAIAS
jgi:hypothetical protein